MDDKHFKDNKKPELPSREARSRIIPNTCISGNGFRNMEELQYNIDTINKNIIDQNYDKLIYSSNIDSIIDSINFNDNILVKTYYLGISLLLLLIMFKILYGKQKI
jgi:hypothetical protein